MKKGFICHLKKEAKSSIIAEEKKELRTKKTKELIKVLGAFNPLEKLKEIYASTDDMALQAKICLDLLKYIYPQRKAIDIEDNGNGATFNIVVADKKHKEMLEEL